MCGLTTYSKANTYIINFRSRNDSQWPRSSIVHPILTSSPGFSWPPHNRWHHHTKSLHTDFLSLSVTFLRFTTLSSAVVCSFLVLYTILLYESTLFDFSILLLMNFQHEKKNALNSENVVCHGHFLSRCTNREAIERLYMHLKILI